MNLNIETIDKVVCGAKSTLHIQPNLNIKGVDFSSLKPISKDLIDFSKVKPEFFDKKEYKALQKELNKFIEEKFVPDVNPPLKPKVLISNHASGDGTCNPMSNIIIINKNILFNPDFNKAVYRKTGKCVEDSELLWQMVGSKSMLEKEIEKSGLKDVAIVPLNKEERMLVAKTCIGHEGFHSIQYGNFVMHPQIGRKKMMNDFLEPTDVNCVLSALLKIIAKSTWKPLEKSGKIIDAESELGKRTMKQFTDINIGKRNKDPKKAYSLYVNSSYEKEAYAKGRDFDIKHNLLLY